MPLPPAPRPETFLQEASQDVVIGVLRATVRGEPVKEFKEEVRVKRVNEFTPDDVARWLTAHGLPKEAAKFKAEGVTGAELLQLSHIALRERFGMWKPGLRRKVKKLVRTSVAVEDRDSGVDPDAPPASLPTPRR